MSKIEPITGKSCIRKSWQRLFKSNDPFSVPFRPEIEACIIFPFTEGCALTLAQYEAIITAARTLGDQGFILSEVEWKGDFFERGKHWWCEFPRHEDYLIQAPILENALYSLHSRWGVLISHEWHAMVGGSETFMMNVDKMYPEWRAAIIDLIESWEKVTPGHWVTNMFIELLDYWKRYPGDEWSAQVTEKFNYKLRRNP